MASSKIALMLFSIFILSHLNSAEGIISYPSKDDSAIAKLMSFLGKVKIADNCVPTLKDFDSPTYKPDGKPDNPYEIFTPPQTSEPYKTLVSILPSANLFVKTFWQNQILLSLIKLKELHPEVFKELLFAIDNKEKKFVKSEGKDILTINCPAPDPKQYGLCDDDTISINGYRDLAGAELIQQIGGIKDGKPLKYIHYEKGTADKEPSVEIDSEMMFKSIQSDHPKVMWRFAGTIIHEFLHWLGADNHVISKHNSVNKMPNFVSTFSDPHANQVDIFLHRIDTLENIFSDVIYSCGYTLGHTLTIPYELASSVGKVNSYFGWDQFTSENYFELKKKYGTKWFKPYFFQESPEKTYSQKDFPAVTEADTEKLLALQVKLLCVTCKNLKFPDTNPQLSNWLHKWLGFSKNHYAIEKPTPSTDPQRCEEFSKTLIQSKEYYH